MRRKGLATLAAASVLAAAVIHGPARADDRGEIVVSHLQTVKKDFPGIPVPMPLADISYNPASCTTPSPYCDRISLKVNLPEHPEDARAYVTLDWQGTQASALNYCILYLWDDPETTGPIKDASCEDNKAVIDFLPLKRDYQLVVRNFTATSGEGYTLTVNYKNFEGEPGKL
ncbi:MAG TPA: hypothetical protein VMY88_08470 [Acidimicrobiales bacterium]|nr:hypothetical protein [Acidimicrobiales bacterium]